MTNTSKLTKNQKITTEYRLSKDGKEKCRAFIEYDDECGNGHNTFSITGETRTLEGGRWKEGSGGCIHETIAEYFPEYAPYIKWHLVSSDSPLHYIANTVYHASDRDYNGLLKGENRQMRNRETGELCWKLEQVGTAAKYIDSNTKLESPNFEYVAWCTEGEGKERDFDAARSCAIWPEASDAQLSLPEEELTILLMARHENLMNDFYKAILELGFKF